MKKSRKGIYLNDAQYFNQSLSQTRKRMTKIQVLPLKTKLLNETTTVNAISNRGVPPTVRMYRSNGLDRDHPSMEMGLITFNNNNATKKSICQALKNHQDVSVETCKPDAEPVVDIEIVNKIKEESKIKSIEESNNNNNICHIMPEEEDEEEEEEEEEAKIQDSVIKALKEKKDDEGKRDEKLSWWKLILDFFGFFWGTSDGSDKRSKKKRNKPVTAKPEDPNIHKNYIMSSLVENKDEMRPDHYHHHHHHNHWTTITNRRVKSFTSRGAGRKIMKSA